MKTEPDRPRSRISCSSSVYCARMKLSTVGGPHESTGEPRLVSVPGQRSRLGGNASTPPYSPITDARRSACTANGPKYRCVSRMSVFGASIAPQQLALPLSESTTAEESSRLICATIPAGSNWSQPSLNGIHETIDGSERCWVTIAESSRRNSSSWAADGPAEVVLRMFGMSCQTRIPSLSAQ